MADTLREKLQGAQGDSEFLITVVADIRGFSTFSKIHESPDIAMYIKRFYIQLMDNFFTNAHFFKPTGDGMLMAFPYKEDSLKDVSSKVIE